MIKFKNTEVMNWESAIRGMRNPMNSWDKSDSCFVEDGEWHDICGNSGPTNVTVSDSDTYFLLGDNDLALMMKLRNAGSDHRKFMRQIIVSVDITAPLYWWKEFDTYKVGTVANSCSTMHKIAEKEFTLEDFSCEYLLEHAQVYNGYVSISVLECVIGALNEFRNLYLKTKDKKYWWQMIQLLPSSYNQLRTVTMNYEVLANIHKSRKNHKLDEWSVGFMDWIKSLPYSELITGEF